MDLTVFEQYNRLNIDASFIGLEKTDSSGYFCDPIGAKFFAALGVDGIHFCFIDGFGEMVFSVTPIAVENKNVNPLAYNFKDFLSLVVACRNSNLIEQIYWMSRDEFYYHLKEELNDPFGKEETEAALGVIQSELKIEPIADPYGYVRELQEAFDYSQIKYSDEYYECSGLDNPNKKRKWWKFGR